jgi:hypothetical protein
MTKSSQSSKQIRARQDLNLRPLAPEASALSWLSYGRICPYAEFMVRPLGFEPRTFGSAGQRSILTELRARLNGGGTGIRTRGRDFNPATA